MINKISANRQVKNSNCNINSKAPAFTSRFFLTDKELRIIPYSEDVLRKNFENVVPDNAMDKFVEQMNKLKIKFEKDKKPNRTVSIMPFSENKDMMLVQASRSGSIFGLKRSTIGITGDVSNLADNTYKVANKISRT